MTNSLAIYIDIFYAASAQNQPLGLVSSTYQHDSFGIYHVDVILNDQYHPFITEIESVTNCDFIYKVRKKKKKERTLFYSLFLNI